MTRNLLIAAAALIGAVLLFYGFVFRPHPQQGNKMAELVDAAEHLCLSNTSSTATATIQSKLEMIKGLSASASAGSIKEQSRGAIATLSGTLKAEQDDKIRTCMQPFIDKMLALTI